MIAPECPTARPSEATPHAPRDANSGSPTRPGRRFGAAPRWISWSLGETMKAMNRRQMGSWLLGIASAGCGGANGSRDDSPMTFGDGTGVSAGSDDGGPTTGSTGANSGATGADDTAGSDADDGVIFDLGAVPDAGKQPVDLCHVADDMNAVGQCEVEAPPNAFQPEVQWVWSGGALGETSCIVTPLVANLTDDDANGSIDLCDVPDVVVVAAVSHYGSAGHIYLLDGATGTEHLRIATDVVDHVTPALGDIDDDGIPEIVAVTYPEGRLVAFQHDGTLAWTGDTVWDDGVAGGGGGLLPDWSYGSIQLADMDADGDVEIIAGNMLADHEGHTLWFATQVAGDWNATTAADLDDDGDLEMVLGHAAFHHDGSQMWVAATVAPGFPQVADLDADGLPEVLVTNGNGISLLQHDGAVVYQDLRPTGIPAGGLNWIRPATIHDFDGDGASELALSSNSHYTVYEADGSIVWDAAVIDASGVAGGTAFDFLGDGIAEAMYADEQRLHVFDGNGVPILQIDRTSATGTEYPVVADIDNDGSAEILVVSNGFSGGAVPTVQAVRDVEDRWIQARRIWNQHAYHVTNVREDGTIPMVQSKSWLELNTFRTNAQIEGGGVCLPPPPG
jgi:hypothetical protein